MPKSTRTFVALPLPEPIVRKLAQLQEKLAGKVAGVRWVDPANFHVTLNFLGDVADTELHTVCRAVAEAARTVEVFDASLGGVGVFPSLARPRVVWIGIKEGESPLIDVHRSLTKALEALGYRSGEPKYHPHVTLGRVKNEKGGEIPDLAGVVDAYRGWSGGSFKAREVVVYASNFGANGPVVYTGLGRGLFRSARSGDPA